MSGLLPQTCTLTDRRAALGYRAALALPDWPAPTQTAAPLWTRGHEYHYAQEDGPLPAACRHLWRLYDSAGGLLREEGCRLGSVAGSWMHCYPEGSRRFWRHLAARPAPNLKPPGRHNIRPQGNSMPPIAPAPSQGPAPAPTAAPSAIVLDPAHTPATIEARSFAVIDAEIPEPRPFSGPLWQVARRCVHTLGDTEIVPDLRLSAQGLRNGLDALLRGCTVFTDTRMAAAGLPLRRLTPLGVSVTPIMSLPGLDQLAKTRDTTRTRAGLELLAPAWAAKSWPLATPPPPCWACWTPWPPERPSPH